MFSSARTSSIARNLAWYDEPIDRELLAGVRRILEPVINQQWDFFKS